MIENKHPEFTGALETIINQGLGNPEGRTWIAARLAENLGVNASTFSQWRKGVHLPKPETVEKLIELVFSAEENRNQYPDEYNVLFELSGAKSSKNTLDVDAPTFSRRQVWNILLRPVIDNVEVFLTDSGDFDDIPGFKYEHLSSLPMEKSFYVPAPEWFRDWASTPLPDGSLPYEINDPIDFSGDPALSDLTQYYPYEEILELIDHHAEIYARAVHNAHNDPRITSLPYNKPKTGLMRWEQHIPSGSDERAYLRITPYQTDYFTNRVSLAVMKEIRSRRPEIFSDLNNFPAAKNMNLSYFTTSLGLNLVVVTADSDGQYFHMAQLTSNIGNANQQNKLHISANEAMNLDDIRTGGLIDYRMWVERALSEELGIVEVESDHASEKIIEDVIFMECSMEMTNYEPYLSGVVFLNIDSARLNMLMKTNARDARREITKLHRFPYTRAGMMDVLINSENGSAGFTTYSLNILNMIIEKNMLDIT